MAPILVSLRESIAATPGRIDQERLKEKVMKVTPPPPPPPPKSLNCHNDSLPPGRTGPNPTRCRHGR